MDHKVHHLVAIVKCIVIPGNEFDKVVIEANASPGIEGRGVGVTIKVAGDNMVFGIAQDALEETL